MIATVAVVGANGRVGRAIAGHLRSRFDVREVVRRRDESLGWLARRAIDGAEVLVNAAGVAHLQSVGAGDLRLLHAGNVELPLALASAAAEAGCSMVHISSVKANAPNTSEYAASKREADDRLEREFGATFAVAGSSLIVIRPLALLFPPLDAGKVSRLRFLQFVPVKLVPPLRLPVLSPAQFLSAVSDAVDRSLSGDAAGYSVVDFARQNWGTMRDVRNAFSQPQERV